jgi:ABC transporter substrate binding protein
MGYGVNFAVMFRRAAVFVDKILKGAKPSEIPVEQATQFKSVINDPRAGPVNGVLRTSARGRWTGRGADMRQREFI